MIKQQYKKIMIIAIGIDRRVENSIKKEMTKKAKKA